MDAPCQRGNVALNSYRCKCVWLRLQVAPVDPPVVEGEDTERWSYFPSSCCGWWDFLFKSFAFGLIAGDETEEQLGAQLDSETEQLLRDLQEQQLAVQRMLQQQREQSEELGDVKDRMAAEVQPWPQACCWRDVYMARGVLCN